MDDGALNDLWQFDPEARQWTQVSAEGAPDARSYHQMVSVGDELFVFGGCGASGRLNDLHSFNTVTKQWTKLPSPPYEGLEGRGGANFTVSADNWNNH